MKRIALFIAILALMATTASAQQKRTYGVGFYNLENLFDTINNNGSYDLEFSPKGARQWNGKKYWSKISNLAYCISEMQVRNNTPLAVLGVSEIENITVLEDLVKSPKLADMGLKIIHHDSPDRRGVDVGLLYNPQYFRVLNVTNHRLTIESNPHFRTRDQMCVTGLLGKTKVSIIVNHWPSRLGGQEQSSYLREAAAALSKQIADSLWAIDPYQGVIIMGDLNDDPQDKSCAKVLGAKKNMDKVAEHGFYNPWWKMLDNGIGTLAYGGGWNLFDQIIVSGTLLPEHTKGLHYSRCRVNNFDFLFDTEGSRQGYPLRTFAAGAFLNGYSDHFPTEIFLTF